MNLSIKEKEWVRRRYQYAERREVQKKMRNVPLDLKKEGGRGAGMRIRLGGCGSGVRGPGYSHKGWGGGEGVSVFWSAERHVGCGVG